MEEKKPNRWLFLQEPAEDIYYTGSVTERCFKHCFTLQHHIVCRMILTLTELIMATLWHETTEGISHSAGKNLERLGRKKVFECLANYPLSRLKVAAFYKKVDKTEEFPWLYHTVSSETTDLCSRGNFLWSASLHERRWEVNNIGDTFITPTNLCTKLLYNGTTDWQTDPLYYPLAWCRHWQKCNKMLHGQIQLSMY